MTENALFVRDQRVVAVRPFALEKFERGGGSQPVPVVDDVEQAAAGVAGDAHLVDAIGGTARRRDALLKGDISRSQDANGWRPLCLNRAV